MSSSDESDNEDKKAALADALQCDFVQQAFAGKFTDKAKSKNLSQKPKEEDKTRAKNFESVIAEILAKRLDEKLRESRNEVHRKVQSREKKYGIQLVRKGRTVTAEDLLTAERNKEASQGVNNKVNVINKTMESQDGKLYKKRASECAVSAEWVCSEVNTKYWVSKYKQRLIKMKKLKSGKKGAIVCEVLEEES